MTNRSPLGIAFALNRYRKVTDEQLPRFNLLAEYLRFFDINKVTKESVNEQLVNVQLHKGYTKNLRYFDNPDFVKLAEAFGCKGYRIEKGEDLPTVLETALKDNTVSIIDCPVDYSENLKLTSKLGEMICPI